MTKYYTSIRPIDGKARKVIVNETGKVINRHPTKEELKGLEKEILFAYTRGNNKYTNEKLLNDLKRFEKENGRIPGATDFRNNSEYPNSVTYERRFGSWSNALKLVELDVESMVKKGVLVTNQQKARLAEIIIRDHFRIYPIDLAGENQNSSCDGICPNNKSYDVKSSKFLKESYYQFNTKNKYKDEIEIYYFLAFNEDWTKLDYGWRIPGEMVEKDFFQVGLNPGYEFTVENMKEYEVTDKIKRII